MDLRQILRKNGLEAQEGEISHRHFRRIKGELTDLKDHKREINHRHFKRIKGELTDLKDFIRGDL